MCRQTDSFKMKFRALTYCFCCLLLLSNSAFAQSRSSNVKVADYSFYEGHFYEAIDLYKEELEKNSNNIYVLIQLANAFQKVGEFKEAHTCFERAFVLGDKEFPLAELYYAQSLKTLGQCGKAKENFEHFRKNYRGNNSSYYVGKAKDELKNCDLALKMKSDNNQIVKVLPNNINKRYSELNPTLFHDSTLIFSTIYSDTLITLPFEYSNPKHRLYSINIRDSLNKAQIFLPQFFANITGDVPDITFSADEKRLYFTECEMNASGKLICELYGSLLTNNEWAPPVKLGPLVNDPTGEYTSTHPAVAYDKKTKQDILYFSSDKPGGNGGLDLWYAEIDAALNVEKAYNLGRKFNSSDNEISPFIDNVGDLYYSSNGLDNIGGYDIFVATDKGKSFDKPKNLGMPFNTSKDEFYFKKYSNNICLMLSNRSDIKRKNIGDDIFIIQKDEKKYFRINAYQKINDSTEQIINETMIVYRNRNDSILQENVFYAAKPKQEFDIEISKKGFIRSTQKIEMQQHSSDTTEIKCYLEPIALNKEYTLNNIYFEYDKAELTTESKNELQQLVIFMLQNPDLKIEVAAHTDNKGNADYNLRLSQERAKSVAYFLISKGINPKALIAKGYGVTQPIAYNNNPDGSDNPEGRQKNRRIIFKVLKKINTSNNEK